MNKDLIDSIGVQAQQAFTNSMAIIKQQRDEEEFRLNMAWEKEKELLGMKDRALNTQLKQIQIAEGLQKLRAGQDTTNISYLADQVLKRQISLESSALTKEEKSGIKSYLAQNGLNIPRKLTPVEQNAQQQATSGLSAVDRTRQILGADNNYNKLDMVFKASLPGFIANIAGAGELRQQLTELSDIITRIRTGAALNNEEIAIYQNYRPQIGDSPEQADLKLRQLEGFYLGISGLPVEVTNPTNGEVYVFQDLFDPKQRLGLREAINAGYKLNY
jgi:hypothetical protein